MSENGIFNEHYKNSNTLEPWDFMTSIDEDAFCYFIVGNILKYIYRAGKKTNEQKDKDLLKAKAYLDELIDHNKKYVSLSKIEEDLIKTSKWLKASNPLIQNLIPNNMSAIDMRRRIKLYLSSQNK